MARIESIATLTEITPVARDTNVYHFLLDEAIPFRPGQFVNLAVPGAKPAGERSYSVYSDPLDPSRLDLAIKLLEGGAASEYLRVSRPGDRMAFRGPFGVFTLADAPGPFWFLGTGTGLAPYRSMLEEAARAGDSRSFRLLFGVRDEEDVFAVDHLDRLVATLPDFQYTLCLSRPSPAWTGFKGRITQRLADATPDTSAHVYLCGNGPMIDEGRAILTAAGFDRKHVHFEKYY